MLLSPWLVYSVIVLLGDLHLCFTKSMFIYKYQLLVPLLYTPFFAIIIWFVTASHIKLLKAPDCYELWVPFIDDMLNDCSSVNLKNLMLMICIVTLRLVYLLVLKDKEVLEAIIRRMWARP